MLGHEKPEPSSEPIPWRDVAARLLGLIEEPRGALYLSDPVLPCLFG